MRKAPPSSTSPVFICKGHILHCPKILKITILVSYPRTVEKANDLRLLLPERRPCGEKRTALERTCRRFDSVRRVWYPVCNVQSEWEMRAWTVRFSFLTFHFLQKAEVYPGSIGTFRYRLPAGPGKAGDGQIQGWVYENVCFELAQDVETVTVPWDGGGRGFPRTWLEERLRERGSEPYSIYGGRAKRSGADQRRHEEIAGEVILSRCFCQIAAPPVPARRRKLRPKYTVMARTRAWVSRTLATSQEACMASWGSPMFHRGDGQVGAADVAQRGPAGQVRPVAEALDGDLRQLTHPLEQRGGEGRRWCSAGRRCT